MTTKPPPPPLFAILARRSDVGVILRRGPSKRVQLILWDRSTDTFTEGAWFYGRIYEDRCDLSPDGSLFVYFAAQQGNPDVSYEGTWTAVSRPPWFTALALWPKGDTWGGGGLFTGDRELWIRHGRVGVVPHEDHKPSGLTITTASPELGEDVPADEGLAHYGWTRVSRLKVSYDSPQDGNFDVVKPHLWQRPVAGGSGVLQWQRTFEGMKEVSAFAIVDGASRHELSGAEWADVDVDRGVVFARDGCLFRVVDGTERQIADFNNHIAHPTKSPDWARRWPWDDRVTSRARDGTDGENGQP